MLGILNKVFDPTKRTISRYEKKANEIEALAQDFEKLSDEALRNKTIEFKEKLEKGQSVDDLLVEAFATVREASAA